MAHNYGEEFVDDLMAGGRSLDKNYRQISAYVPRDLHLEFKLTVTRQDTTISEAIEQAVRLWIEHVKDGKELPDVQERADQRFSQNQEGN